MCCRKIAAVGRSGRTVTLVAHFCRLLYDKIPQPHLDFKPLSYSKRSISGFSYASSSAMPQGIGKSSCYWEPMRIHKACYCTSSSSPLVTRVPLAGGGLALPLDQLRCHIWGRPAVQSMSLLGIRHWNLRGCYGGYHNTQSMLRPIVGADALFPRQCGPYVYQYLFK
jgi:hypothetical protein